MNYPVWHLDFAGGGLLIAMIAVFHVYISHFAIGGGLFLVLTEMKGYRENSQAILDYTRQHTKFFLLLTLVLGAITGVGIWFVIALIAPAATSILIHNFVFGWATEWVFFVGEIVSIFVYFYTFGRMERRNHLIVGWLYFIFAWFSLFVINGIIGFMLTPGDWLTTGNFWDGFFNPTFWPALFFRTFFCLMLAGLYGFLTSTAIKDEKLRLTMVRYCATWLLAPFLLFLASGYWYVQVLPPGPKNWIMDLTPELAPALNAFLWISPVLFLGGLLMAIRLPQTAKRSLAVVLLVIGLAYMGSFEYVREGSRRPYTIHGHIYANSVLSNDLESLEKNGLAATAKWLPARVINDENRMAMGRQLYYMLCSSCHSLGGPVRDIKQMTAKYGSVYAMEAEISGQGKLIRCMPPFPGTREEANALATYIVEGIHKKKGPAPEVSIPELTAKIPPFDPAKDEYVLLAWSTKGMHTMSDADGLFSIRPPASSINALLIRRGELPGVVNDGVTVGYAMENGFADPADQVPFWDNAEAITGSKIARNTGITGNALSGTMEVDLDRRIFVARSLPVVPYNDKGEFRPYPMLTITAKDASGNILATTKVVAPVSTEMGCKNCHGGTWRKEVAGLSPVAGRDILAMHDRFHKTNLRRLAETGRPMPCQSCHPDPRSGKADTRQLSLSAAVHGFHANFLANRGPETCNLCHPSDPTGATRFLRGIHKDMGFDCTQCHGTMEDHALSLLLAEKKAGKPEADRLIQYLKPKATDDPAAINPRQAWINEPDCLTCHVDFAAPETDSAFNRWTGSESELFARRSDNMGLPCAACHNSPHAVYPARNPYVLDRDNTGPMQHQGNPYPIGANKNCRVCHTVDMADEMHHPNSLRMMRNVRE